VSSNTSVERCGVFARVVRTRIGSPFVIEAMAEAARQGNEPVVGYEANGGFLLWTAIERRRGDVWARLTPLPTRDALLPILSLLSMAAERSCKVSELNADLPLRFTASDRLQNFEGAASHRLLERLASSTGTLAAFFAPLGEVADVNQVDGLRVTLKSGDIVHLRPSGNAPELRCYAEAGTPKRACELSRWGLAAAKASAP